jgi:hypothetical protein
VQFLWSRVSIDRNSISFVWRAATGGIVIPTLCSEVEGECPIICDFCTYYEDDGIIGKTEGYCLEHEKMVAIDSGCDDFHCMNAKGEYDASNI